jgi:hypothetical protein
MLVSPVAEANSPPARINRELSNDDQHKLFSSFLLIELFASQYNERKGIDGGLKDLKQEDLSRINDYFRLYFRKKTVRDDK